MAFLHRVVNGGGTLEREYAIGRDCAERSGKADRMDLCLRYGKITLGIELKAWRDKKGDPLEDGLEQLDSYLGFAEKVERVSIVGIVEHISLVKCKNKG